MDKDKLIAFIDIDGVIRPTGNPAGVISPDCLERIQRLIKYTDADVVISSTWRHAYDISYFQEMFCGRVVGVTPTVQEHECRHPRYQEIISYLEENTGIKRQWIAVDDASDQFPELDNIFITNPAEGFTMDTLTQIALYLEAA